MSFTSNINLAQNEVTSKVITKEVINKYIPSNEELLDLEWSRLQAIVDSGNELQMMDFTQLYWLLGSDKLEKALVIIDNKDVTEFKAKLTGRSYFSVASARKGQQAPYILIGDHFCSCPAFINSLRPLYRMTSVDNCGKFMPLPSIAVCKHQLAAKLAQILSKFETVLISEERFAECLCSHII